MKAPSVIAKVMFHWACIVAPVPLNEALTGRSVDYDKGTKKWILRFIITDSKTIVWTLKH